MDSLQVTSGRASQTWSAASTNRGRCRQLAASQFEGRVAAQVIEVVGVLVAAGDRQNARTQDVTQLMHDPAWIAMIGNLRRQSITDAETSFRLRQQDNAAI